MRRRHQDDGLNLTAILRPTPSTAARAPLLASSKSIEQAEDQAMLSLARHEKRLNAFEELSGI